MADHTEELARRIVRAVLTHTDGKPQLWLPVQTATRLLVLKDDPRLEAALQFAVDQGWLLVEGGHLCLRDAGRRLVTH
jgi:hypothetical protein